MVRPGSVLEVGQFVGAVSGLHREYGRIQDFSKLASFMYVLSEEYGKGLSG